MDLAPDPAIAAWLDGVRSVIREAIDREPTSSYAFAKAAQLDGKAFQAWLNGDRYSIQLRAIAQICRVLRLDAHEVIPAGVPGATPQGKRRRRSTK